MMPLWIYDWGWISKKMGRDCVDDGSEFREYRVSKVTGGWVLR